MQNLINHEPAVRQQEFEPRVRLQEFEKLHESCQWYFECLQLTYDADLTYMRLLESRNSMRWPDNEKVSTLGKYNKWLIEEERELKMLMKWAQNQLNFYTQFICEYRTDTENSHESNNNHVGRPTISEPDDYIQLLFETYPEMKNASLYHPSNPARVHELLIKQELEHSKLATELLLQQRKMQKKIQDIIQRQEILRRQRQRQRQLQRQREQEKDSPFHFMFDSSRDDHLFSVESPQPLEQPRSNLFQSFGLFNRTPILSNPLLQRPPQRQRRTIRRSALNRPPLFQHMRRNVDLQHFFYPSFLRQLELEHEQNNDDIINSLAEISIRESNIGDLCVICQVELEQNEKILDLGVCQHSFHSGCIKDWLKKKAECPLCKKRVTKRQAPSIP